MSLEIDLLNTYPICGHEPDGDAATNTSDRKQADNAADSFMKPFMEHCAGLVGSEPDTSIGELA